MAFSDFDVSASHGEQWEEEGIVIHRFTGEETGPHFTVFGAMHGDEHCGPQAIKRLIRNLERNEVVIRRGSLTLVPVCNPQAFQQNKRYIDRNLNRNFEPKNPEDFTCYEDRLVPVLAKLLTETEYFLDLHSFASEGGPFAVLGGEVRDKENKSYVDAVGIPHIICGLHKTTPQNKSHSDKMIAQGAVDFARLVHTLAVRVECGHHLHPHTADIGQLSIFNILDYLDMAYINSALYVDMPNLPRQPLCVDVQTAVTHTKEGRFLHRMSNMDFYDRGVKLARYTTGEEVVMPFDGYIVLPQEDAPIGDEWFYLAEKLG